MPQISVIVPVHNRADLLPETLDSVRAQTFDAWECIVVDDHSTDKSAEVANSYASCDYRFRAVSLPASKRYVNAARNYGLSLARAELVNFLDSDDLFAADKLARQIAYLASHPDVDMVACRGFPFKAIPGDVQNVPRFAAPDRWLDAVLFQPECGTLWPSHGPVWRKSAIVAIGGWDEAIRNFTDPEINFRALSANMQIVRLEDSLVYWRIADGSQLHLSAQVALYRTAVHRIWDGYVRAGLVTPLRRRVLARRLFQIAQRQVDSGYLVTGIRIWLEDASRCRMPLVETFMGSLSLLIGRLSYRLGRSLRTKYFRSLCVCSSVVVERSTGSQSADSSLTQNAK